MSIVKNSIIHMIRTASITAVVLEDELSEIGWFILSLGLLKDAQCTFPADLRGSWISADRGTLNFAENKLSGYSIQLSTKLSSVDFDCKTLSNNQYYLRGTNPFTVFGISKRPHICLEFYSLTSDKYYYHVVTVVEPTIKERIYVEKDGNPVTHGDVCNRQTPFEVGTYVMLIKDGLSDASLAVECPEDISRNFENVKFSSSDRTYSCSGKLEVLTDKLKMNYTYNSCDNNLIFSVDGLWRCLYNTKSDSTTYLAALNMDASLVNGQTYRLVCYTLKWQGKTLKATTYPGSCRLNQTASYVFKPGVFVEMSDLSDHGLGYVTNEGVAVGISVAVIVVCIIVVTVLFWRRNVRKKTAPKVFDLTSIKSVDNSLGQQDVVPPQYPTDDKILYSQVSKGTQHYPSEDTQSPYSLSVEGVYDKTNERRHVINDTNVYSHAVDTVYDSSEQHTRQDRKEEVYDHVVGQKLED